MLDVRGALNVVALTFDETSVSLVALVADSELVLVEPNREGGFVKFQDQMLGVTKQ